MELKHRQWYREKWFISECSGIARSGSIRQLSTSCSTRILTLLFPVSSTVLLYYLLFHYIIVNAFLDSIGFHPSKLGLKSEAPSLAMAMRNSKVVPIQGGCSQIYPCRPFFELIHKPGLVIHPPPFCRVLVRRIDSASSSLRVLIENTLSRNCGMLLYYSSEQNCVFDSQSSTLSLRRHLLCQWIPLKEFKTYPMSCVTQEQNPTS